MKRQALIRRPQKIIHLSWLMGVLLAASFMISCSPSFDIDWNGCYIDASVVTGHYQVTDECSAPFGSSGYVIAISGECETYAISNLFDPDTVALVSLTYFPYYPPQLYIPEQQYLGGILQGSGSITDGLITLSLTLTKSDNVITCTVTGRK